MGSTFRVGLIGAGAVGVYYTSLLSDRDRHFTLFTRSVDAYTNPTIKIDSVLGGHEWTPDVVHPLGEGLSYELDMLLVATKVHPEINLPELISPYLSKQTVVVLIQNGIFIEDQLMKMIRQPILRALAFICCYRHDYQYIEHIDYGPLTIGIKQTGEDALLAQQALNVFEKSEIDVSIESNIDLAIWKKLVWNAPFNPLSVLHGGVSTDQLLNSSDSFHQVVMIMDEVINVANIAGVRISEQFREKMILNTRNMAPYKTSMCLDYESNQPIELDAILGNFIAYAKACDIEVPMAESVYHQCMSLLKPI
ncbi:MAG: ketopantoate reductase family protein [Candidatus Marinamargulisbacteria bacterium]